MEILLQIILEPLCFAYFDLVKRIVDNKQLKKGQEYFLKILCGIISVIAIFLILIGAFWMLDDAPFKTYGTVMLIIGVSILLIHIVIGLVAGGNHFVEEKRKEEIVDNQNFEKNEPTPIIYYVEADNSENDP